MKIRKLYWNEETNRFSDEKHNVKTINKVDEYLEKDKKFLLKMEKYEIIWGGMLIFILGLLIISGFCFILLFIEKFF